MGDKSCQTTIPDGHPGKHHQVGWIADNGALIGSGFLVASVKRGFKSNEGMGFQNAGQGLKEVTTQLKSTHKDNITEVLDRGYINYKTAKASTLNRFLCGVCDSTDCVL